MRAFLFGWSGVLLWGGVWRRDCGMGPGNKSTDFVFASLYPPFFVSEEGWMSLTFIQGREDLTKRDVRVTGTSGKGAGVVRSVLREGIHEKCLVA